MKAKVLQVHWHEQQPIFSLSFDNYGRLATAGGDHKIRLWSINQQSIPSHDGMSMNITYRSTLKRHLKAVNIVRFHPNEHVLASGGDGGTIIIWKLKDMSQNTDENIPNVQNQREYLDSLSTSVQSLSSSTFIEDGEDDESEPDAEIWIPTAVYRASENLEDIYDMCWSKFGDFLIVGMTNNTASIWDIQQGRCIKILKDHHHFVQGVSWDLLDSSLIATQSSDRSIRIYKVSINEKITKTGVIKAIYTKCIQTLDRFPVMKQGKLLMQRLYHDETLVSFFRRLCFSPDGGLLLVPTGLFSALTSNESCSMDHSSHTLKHCVYLYTRASLINNPGCHAMPIGYLGPFDKPAIAIAPYPHLLELSQDFTGKGWMSLPYRMIFAIATLNAVYLYDTIQKSPIALIRDLHYGSLTDMSWSSDGKYLMISSTDGYCSIISLDDSIDSLGNIYHPQT